MGPVSPITAVLIGSAATKIHYPEYRNPPDLDFYAAPAYVDEFLILNPDAQIVFRDSRKAVIRHLGTKIDITTVVGGSWTEYILLANCASQRLHFRKTVVALAKPTTLLLIKQVLSQFPNQQTKNSKDYEFLRHRVTGDFSESEKLAIITGVENFSQETTECP